MQTPVCDVVPSADFCASSAEQNITHVSSVMDGPIVFPLPVAVEAKLADFGAALTGALITNNTLELVNGTFFLGRPSLGSKIFIRSCYKELSALILGGASSDTFHNIVVTGTPGIGKSVFGFYLLYLLRCQGKTVVFELKGKWYRFSDAGVVQASLEAFNERGYMDDPNSWYLSDPEDRPREYFQGTTVVLVSPKYERVKEFLKLADAQQIFMPVWGLDELLKCQRAVFPHVPSTFVEEAFGVVGGVARAIFNELKYVQVKDGIEDAVNKLSLATLREEVSLLTSSGRLPTDITGDKLFHVFSDSSDGFKRYTVTFASNFTSELVIRKIAEKGRRSLLDFAGAAIDHKDVARMFGGGSVVGSLFEHAAHQVIGWDRAGEEPLKMAILIDSGGVLSGTDSLNFSFEKREGFKGETIYSSFDQGVYYTAVPFNYPAIDSFGMDRRGDTLFFFQMKYAGVEAVIGSTVERYWRSASKGSVSVKNCVYVYVVPEEPQWRSQAVKSAGIDEVRKLLSGASDDFLSACAVCVVAIPSRNFSNDVE